MDIKLYHPATCKSLSRPFPLSFPSIITPGALFSFLSLQSLLVPFLNYQLNLVLKSKRVKVKEWSAVQFGWIPQTQEKLSWLAVIWKGKLQIFALNLSVKMEQRVCLYKQVTLALVHRGGLAPTVNFHMMALKVLQFFKTMDPGIIPMNCPVS